MDEFKIHQRQISLSQAAGEPGGQRRQQASSREEGRGGA